MTTYSFDVSFDEREMIIVDAALRGYAQSLEEQLRSAPETARFRLEADLKRARYLSEKLFSRPQLMSYLVFGEDNKNKAQQPQDTWELIRELAEKVKKDIS